MIHTDLGAAAERWPRFAPEAVSAGFGSVDALPLRLRTAVIGALNLFRAGPGFMAEVDVHLAQALADVANIAILQDKALCELEVRAGELQHALDSRVAIEQAKGMLAERGHVDMDEAFRVLRGHARAHNRPLTALAMDIVSGALALDAVGAATASAPHRRP